MAVKGPHLPLDLKIVFRESLQRFGNDFEYSLVRFGTLFGVFADLESNLLGIKFAWNPPKSVSKKYLSEALGMSHDEKN